MEYENKPIGSMSIQQIEDSRKRLHDRIDEQYDELVSKALTEGHEVRLPKGQRMMSLAADPARFKGLKPAMILFPDGRTTSVTKWKSVILAVMQDCNKDPVMHERLMRLRGMVNGRFRAILTDRPEGMDVPLMIDEDLYLEGKLDTEFLFKITTKNILNAVGYDYGRIGVAVHDPKLDMDDKQNFSKGRNSEMTDKQYMKEWTEICAAYCEKVGAELLFVNLSDFGCMMPNGETQHIYADELEARLNALEASGGIAMGGM